MPKIYLGSLPGPINCKSFTLTLSLNTDMNAEQLARDIKSLDQAHRAADGALKPYPGLSIGAKVESLSKEFVKLSQRPVETPYRRGEDRHEIRNRLINALGQHSVGPGTDTLGLVEKVVDLCTLLRLNNKSLTESYEALKAEQGNTISSECSQATHNQLNRVLPRSLNRLDVRVKELVDELLKLRQQGETNNSRLEEEDRLEIREKLITALGCGRFTSTVAMVDLVLGELQHTRAEAASDTAKNFNASILRLKAKADFEELKQEHQKLSEKHQELHSNYKLLQALSIGQPKGLAPEKEKWVATPSQCSSRYAGLFRVMRDNEDATPHPVSKAVAEAIAMELNGR